MELHAPYQPPTEPDIPRDDVIEYVPPTGFVDYWNWERISDDRGGVATGRLAPWLREAAQSRDPRTILRQAVVRRVNGERTESDALADLSVTGRSSYAAFRESPPTDEELVEDVSRELAGTERNRIRNAVRSTLDRAYRVAWALRGSPTHRRDLRPSLGWIALSSEDDPPHAPTNVPCTDDHMGELAIRVGSRRIYKCRAAIKVAAPPTSDPLPDSTTRVVPSDRDFLNLLSRDHHNYYHDLIIFIHGLGSRLEESEHFKQLVIDRNRRFAVLSVDLPGVGYSERLNIDNLIAERSTGHHGFTLPNGLNSNFPLLGLYRDFIVALSRQISGGIQYVMGGSLGGNLTLWLAEEPMFTVLEDSGARLLGAKRFAAWSPASIWESYERSRDTPFEGNGTHVDIGKNGAKKKSMARMREAEGNNSRYHFFETMQRGEEIFGLHLLSAWGYPPTKDGLLLQSELYSEAYRRTFWTTAYEQVEFSHQEPLSPSETWPFRTIEQPLLLATGSLDVGSSDVMDIYNPSKFVTDNSPDVPGKRLLMLDTGHSISDERPQHLAEQVAEFFSLARIRLFVLGSDGAVYGRYQREPNGGWNEEGWGSLGGTDIRQIAVGSNPDGRIQLFALGGDGAVYGRYQREPNGGWNEEGWGSLGGTDIRQIAVGSNPDGRTQLFALGGDGAVYGRYQREPNGGWNEGGWGSLGGTDIRQIAVGSNADGRTELFALGGDGAIYNRWQRKPNGGWNEGGWGSLGGVHIRQIAVGNNADGRIQLFTLGGDGAVYGRYQREPNGGWNEEGWGSLGGVNVRQIAVGSNADGRTELFALGGDGAIYNRWQRKPNGGWNEGGWGFLGRSLPFSAVTTIAV